MLDEILNIYKEAGWTSNDVVRKLKSKLFELKIKPKVKSEDFSNILEYEKFLKTEWRKFKIGHAGTLDPFATGLLLIMLGKATKKFDEFQKLKKEYIAEIEFGKVTDTYDVTGKTIFEFDEMKNGKINLQKLEKEFIEKKLEKYLGKILQTPPIYSALKINGKKMYELARQNKINEESPEVKNKKREVEVFEIEILKIDENILTVRYLVSSGTYIRSLAYDLGESLGYGAYLKSLQRTKIGEFKVENAKKIAEF